MFTPRTPPTVLLGPAEIATLIAEYEASDAALSMAHQRHAINTRGLAAALARSGPQVAGPWRYSGHVTAGLPGDVMRVPAGSVVVQVPIEAAHAAVSITEDDGEID